MDIKKGDLYYRDRVEPLMCSVHAPPYKVKCFWLYKVVHVNDEVVTLKMLNTKMMGNIKQISRKLLRKEGFKHCKKEDLIIDYIGIRKNK